MPDFIAPVAGWAAALIELLGVAIIVLVTLYGLFHAIRRLLGKEDRDDIFLQLRQRVGRGILLGLEFLIAADIIYTVVVELTLATIGGLALVVLIRTFLSFTLDVELNGRWPWQEEAASRRPLSRDLT